MKKHILIIGGARGMSRALVKLLAKDHLVSVIDRVAPLEEDLNLENVTYWTVDILDDNHLSTSLKEIIKQNGKLHNLVFFQRYRGSGDDWKGEFEVGLTATKKIIELLVDKFDNNDCSNSNCSIVIISSGASRLIVDEQPLSYHVSKAGLNHLVNYYAVRLGPHGIRVNCILPGTILKEESKDFYLKNEKLQHLYKKLTPLGRMGTSEDIANVIAFLCSPLASFVTGQAIEMDGGVSLQGHESVVKRFESEDI